MTQIDHLIHQYGRLIRSVVARVGGARLGGDKDEVEQRVIIALWKRVEREQKIEYPSSYIYRAAVRETVRLLREVLNEATEPIDGPAVATLKAAENPHRTLEGKEIQIVISACLKELDTERERAVRAHLAGFDVREMMSMYRWSYNKARNLIARGMADLRQAIREREKS